LTSKTSFRKAHDDLYEKSKNTEVKEYIEDVMMMTFEEK